MEQLLQYNVIEGNGGTFLSQHSLCMVQAYIFTGILFHSQDLSGVNHSIKINTDFQKDLQRCCWKIF